MRIVFAGTPIFAEIQLQALLQAKRNIVAVYTQQDKPAGRGQHLQMSPVKMLAQRHDIPVEQPISLKSPEALATLEQYQADVMIVAAYGLLLPEAILTLPRFGCINVHASILPRWRGASPIQQAILAGDQETGISLMQMDIGLDTGDILAQKNCEITKEDTSETLHDKLAQLGAELLVEKLEEITHSPAPRKQSNMNTPVTHAGKITKEQGRIDWHTSAKEIDQKIRAFNPWPVAFTHIDGTLIRIWKALASPGTFIGKTPGSIIDHTPTGILVATADGSLCIEQAQLPGKKVMAMSEILKGHAHLFAIGQQFN